MRERFPGYYRPSEKEFAALWKDALFVPDTNILLHLFRYGQKTRDQVIDTLERLRPRVWIPYRVGLEFQRRWRDVDQTNRDAYGKLCEEIKRHGAALAALFDAYTRHQLIDAGQEKEAINRFVNSICERLNSSQQKHPDKRDAESIFSRITVLIGSAVGERPSVETQERLVAEGQKRYDTLIPPGYRDAKSKDGNEKFGDFFIWKEILDKAKGGKTPIIMITDDVKDDWFYEFRGEKIGPRPELVEELHSYAGQRFYLYTLSQFLDYAGAYLNKAVDNEAIEEIKSDEIQRREVARRVRQNAIPRAFTQPLQNALKSQNRRLRQRLLSIDTRLEELAASEDSDAPSQVSRLLRERRALTNEIHDNKRRLRDLWMESSGLLALEDGVPQKQYHPVLRWLEEAANELRKEPRPGNSDGPESATEDEGEDE